IRNWVWLKMLKASARSSRLVDSLVLKCLSRAISKFKRFGLFREFLPTSPKVSPSGAVNAAGLLSNGPKVNGAVNPLRKKDPLVGLRSGNDPAPVPLATPALSRTEIPVSGLPPLITVNGIPDWKVVTPVNSHCSRRFRANQELKKPEAWGGVPALVLSGLAALDESDHRLAWRFHKSRV